MIESIEDVILPNALMIGVDYDLFWELNPKSLQPFIKAFSLKQKYDDALAWRSGMYIRMAIASSMDKNCKYPSSPLSETSANRVMSGEEIKAKMMIKAQQHNSRFRKEEC